MAAKEASEKLSADIATWELKYCRADQLRTVQSMWEVPSMGLFLCARARPRPAFHHTRSWM